MNWVIHWRMEDICCFTLRWAKKSLWKEKISRNYLEFDAVSAALPPHQYHVETPAVFLEKVVQWLNPICCSDYILSLQHRETSTPSSWIKTDLVEALFHVLKNLSSVQITARIFPWLPPKRLVTGPSQWGGAAPHQSQTGLGCCSPSGQ